MSDATRGFRGTPIRVLLVDDQDLYREGLRTLLSTRPDLEVVGEAGNGEEALRLAAALQPDVVLMDLRMPVMDGATTTHRLLGQRPTCRVIMLSTFDDADSRAQGLNAGATSYLLKDTSLEDLVKAIRAAVCAA
ncbi:MAG TPA: response regulator transcription factor [Anaerolineae bacterium]|nr:response regulator transcription factor [Anaerolineae bacterium]